MWGRGAMSAEEDTWTLEPGDLIDNYIVERKIGQGGMGAVFKARHKETKYPVAIKILVGSAASNPQIIARFRREASAANEIDHPGFVRAIHLGSHRDRLYMIMELLEGTTLAEEAKVNPLPAPRAVRILLQIGDALGAAHRHGVVHRDLKPDNVFLLPGDVVRILDLGIAKFLNDTAEANKTHSNAILGTPHTMSPEQCRGAHIDHRSDVYAFGVVAYRILAARWPIEGQYIGDIQAGHMFEEPPSLRQVAPWVPAGLADVIHRALKKDPAARFQSMAELCGALAPYAEASGPEAATVQAVAREASTPSARGEVRRRPSRGRSGAILVPAAALAVLGAVGGAIYFAAAARRGAEAERAHLAAAAEAAREAAPAKPEETFRVFVDVTPADAQVLVDGVAREGRPVIVEGTPGRTASVQARREGYRELTQAVRIGDRDERLTLRLVEDAAEPAEATGGAATRGFARLIVNVQPWANVYVDGVKRDDTPCNLRLPAGPHRVLLVNQPLGKRDEIKVNIPSGGVKKIDRNWNVP